MSGLVTRGKRACNVCADNLTCIVSSYLKKTIYPSFRQFLPLAHKWRKPYFKRKFGNHLNKNPIPMRPDGRYWIRRWKQIRETNMPKDRRGMKRLSALFTLPYWKVFIQTMHPKAMKIVHKNIFFNYLYSLQFFYIFNY